MSSSKNSYQSLPVLLGAFVVGSLSSSSDSGAVDNPFNSTPLPAGYMLAAEDKAQDKEGKCGEGKCGGKADSEAVCGIYTIGSAHKDDSQVKDGKCGGHKLVESLCGGER